MFAVPEVDDDIEASTPVETAKPITELEEKGEFSPIQLPAQASTLVNESENNPIKVPAPPLVRPLPSKEHRSRRGLFHRNTIHICDQIVDRITSHQQHHSAPPSQNQQLKTGLQSINENVEYFTINRTTEQQQRQQQNSANTRFPRSTTVPYPAYATFRRGGGNSLSSHYYYTDYPALFHESVSPTHANIYYSTRQPLSSINADFQPISPHHQQYVNRPVDILKPTFLIVPKEAEQQLISHISSSTSPVQTTNTITKMSPKPIVKKTDTKLEEKTSASVEHSSPTVRSVEVQTNNHSANVTTTAGITTVDNTHQYVDVIATPNPSPYVHFVNVAYPTQSSQFSYDGPPETSIMNDDFMQINDYNQSSAGIRSMPNIALAQVSPHHLHGSSIVRHNKVSQQMTDDQERQQQVPVVNIDLDVTRSATVPPITTTSKNTRNETGEADESSVASLDFGQTDFVDVPGSWRYRSLPDGRSVPIATATRRYRAPIPRAFFDAQQYPHDSQQVTRSYSFRHPQQQQPQQTLAQSRPFGSIPTINQPFDSIRSHQQIPLNPSVRLNERDVLKIASFYKSIGTAVYVASGIATLYASDFDAMANLKDWKKLYTGVPLWLFNTGMNPKRARCIRLIISELGSSFTLWDTIVNGASDVRLPKPRHITLKSLETGTVLALKFDDTTATDEFHQYFVKLSSDPRNADLFDIFNIKRRQPTFILRKRKIKKSAISKPTEFTHITKLDEHDRDSLYTYSVLVDDAAVVG